MESKPHALIAGLFAIGLAILSTIFALWLGKDEIARTRYTIATTLKVSGLNMQAAVRYKGIKVGKVTGIDFDSKTPGQLLLKLDITSDTPITQSTFATLGYQGVTGIAYVELDDDGSQPTPLASGNTQSSRIPLRPGLLQDLEKRGIAILEQTEEMTKRMNALLDQDNRRSLNNAVNQITRTAAAWEAIPAKLDPLLTQLPAAIQQANTSFAAFQQFSDSAKNTSNNINQVALNLQASDGAFNKISQNIDLLSANLQQETLPNISGISRDARTSLRSINRATQVIGDNPQSLLFGTKPTEPGPGESGFSKK